MFSPDRFGIHGKSFGNVKENVGKPYNVGRQTYKSTAHRNEKAPGWTPLRKSATFCISDWSSSTPTILDNRGYRPSDLLDPSKREFLTRLTNRVFHLKLEGENDGSKDKIPLERLFTPAADFDELELKNRKLYSSSSFYRPDHPTIQDQVHLAHKISFSLVDDVNKQSKGQCMYMKRKSKSTKWVHTGQEAGFLEGNWQPNEADLLPPKESKEPPPLKLLLNPRGIHDYNSIQTENYEEYATANHSQHQISGIGVGKEISIDLQSPTGKGAALFAKRKKRMDKFIIDETNVQKSINKHDINTVEENSHSSTHNYRGTIPINNTPSRPESRNLPDLSNILIQPNPVVNKSILCTPKGKTIKRSNTVSFPSLDRGFPPRTQTHAMRERRGQIKSWGSQKTTGISLDIVAGNRLQTQKRFSNIELNSTPKYYSNDRRPLDYGKKQKTNAIYRAEVKLEEITTPLSPSISMDFNGLDRNHYLDLAMDYHEKRKSFNLAAKGWGTYNHFYTPVHLGTS